MKKRHPHEGNAISGRHRVGLPPPRRRSYPAAGGCGRLSAPAVAVPTSSRTGTDLQQQPRIQVRGGQSAEKSTWRVWVVCENKKGGWRLVIRHGISRSRVRDGKAQTSTEDVAFSYCDIRANGRMEENDSFGFRQ